MYRNTITIECVTDEPLPASTPLSEISYAVCTHLWPMVAKSIRSRPMTRAEVAALERLPERDQVRVEEIRNPNAEIRSKLEGPKSEIEKTENLPAEVGAIRNPQSEIRNLVEVSP